MEKTYMDLLGISEMKQTGMGQFTSDEHEIYYCEQETLKCNIVAFICNNKLRRCVMGFNPVNDRIAIITRNQIDYILCKTRWKSSIKRVTTLPGADCGTAMAIIC